MPDRDLSIEEAVMGALDHMRSWTNDVTGALLGLTVAVGILAALVWKRQAGDA